MSESLVLPRAGRRQRELLDKFLADSEFSDNEKASLHHFLDIAAISGTQHAIENFFLGLDPDSPVFRELANARAARITRRKLGARRGFESTILTGPRITTAGPAVAPQARNPASVVPNPNFTGGTPDAPLPREDDPSAGLPSISFRPRKRRPQPHPDDEGE